MKTDLCSKELSLVGKTNTVLDNYDMERYCRKSERRN